VTHDLTTIVHFDGTNGAQPYSGLHIDSAGNLFGTTLNGQHAGGIFKIAAGTNAFSILANFTTEAGSANQATLISDAAGNLYGTGVLGGPLLEDGGYGTVFKMDAVTHQLSLLASFNNLNGAFPYSSLVLDEQGNLYGTTSGNPGSDGNLYGSVFMLSPVPEPATILLAAFAIPFWRRLRSGRASPLPCSTCLIQQVAGTLVK
jgi:hypothetical protein